MIISDLEHLAIVSEETEIEGGFLDKLDIALIKTGAPVAISRLVGEVTAVGNFTKTLTLKKQETVAGLFSKTAFDSTSISIG